MDYKIYIILLFGAMGIFGLIFDLIYRKNIINRLDGFFSAILDASFFIIMVMVLLSNWKTPLPYLLSVGGYAIIVLLIYYLRNVKKTK